jgi:DNA-binding CsgD family transcriptional regulator
VGAVDEIERAHRAYSREAWSDVYESLSRADDESPLAADDLRLLATSAYMLGRESEYVGLLERAHRGYLDDGDPLAALRCAFWIAVTAASRRDLGRAGGWLGRAQRLLDEQGDDRVERGYLLLPLIFEQDASGDLDGAAATAGDAAGIAERFGDPDLFALAAHEHGHILIRMGRTKEGLGLLDETMVAVTAGELSPIVSGIVYCGVILACRDAYEVGRAQEWTAALSGWCERQPDLVAFTGRCLVHRAEIMHLNGAWSAALEEARRAAERCEEGENAPAVGEACYRQGEVHRMLGEFGLAKEAYRKASQCGREPQPGLALLRLAEGQADAAEAAIRRVLTETVGAGSRVAFLPAYVEIMLAVGDFEAARGARELEVVAESHEGGALGGMAAQARGTVELAVGRAPAALASLRRAEDVWQRLGAPYEGARVRELVGLACRALGDEDAAALELDAAGTAYSDLGAAPDRARIDGLGGARLAGAHGLTERELEVLRHLAAGETNKAIAADLVLSERTVDRHVSNIFAKLAVSSRTAAASYAHRHGLI